MDSQKKPTKIVVDLLKINVIGAALQISTNKYKGQCDCYIKFSVDSHAAYQTDISNKGIKPEWNENFTLYVKSI
jgi:Ca2+-dependent lipid-binding protein